MEVGQKSRIRNEENCGEDELIAQLGTAFFFLFLVNDFFPPMNQKRKVERFRELINIR